MKLLKIHKNMLYEAIISHHLNPLDFEYDEGRLDIKIHVTNKKFYFNFTSDRFSIFPFKNLYRSYEFLTNYRTIDEYLNGLNVFFKDWLRLISIEMRTEDKWDAFIKKSNDVPLVDNISFSGDKLSYVEVQELNRAIITARNKLTNLSIDEQLRVKLYERLNYLGNTSKVIEAKEDWINLAKGVLISELVSINKKTTEEIFQKIIDIFKETFQKFFTFGF